MFSISDRRAKFFGISGASMEHNASAKSNETFFLLFCINGPGLCILVLLLHESKGEVIFEHTYIIQFIVINLPKQDGTYIIYIYI